MAEKIGILTFHCAHNYGAVLQTYATQVLLTQAGYEVDVIDYRPDFLIKPYLIFDSSRFVGRDLISSLRHFVSETLLFPSRLKRYRAFEKFISGRLHLSERMYTLPMDDEYTAILIGSDQVWNPTFGRMSDIDFLTFADKEKRNSFSASFGISEIPEDMKEYYK